MNEVIYKEGKVVLESNKVWYEYAEVVYITRETLPGGQGPSGLLYKFTPNITVEPAQHNSQWSMYGELGGVTGVSHAQVSNGGYLMVDKELATYVRVIIDDSITVPYKNSVYLNDDYWGYKRFITYGQQNWGLV